jgi:hypothetical protein
VLHDLEIRTMSETVRNGNGMAINLLQKPGSHALHPRWARQGVPALRKHFPSTLDHCVVVLVGMV